MLLYSFEDEKSFFKSLNTFVDTITSYNIHYIILCLTFKSRDFMFCNTAVLTASILNISLSTLPYKIKN